MANAVAPLDQQQSLAYEKLLHRNLWGVFLRVKSIAFTNKPPKLDGNFGQKPSKLLRMLIGWKNLFC